MFCFHLEEILASLSSQVILQPPGGSDSEEIGRTAAPDSVQQNRQTQPREPDPDSK